MLITGKPNVDVCTMAEYDDGSSTESEYYDEEEELKGEGIGSSLGGVKEPSIEPSLSVSNGVQAAITSSDPAATKRPEDGKTTPSTREQVAEQAAESGQGRSIKEPSSAARASSVVTPTDSKRQSTTTVSATVTHSVSESRQRKEQASKSSKRRSSERPTGKRVSPNLQTSRRTSQTSSQSKAVLPTPSLERRTSTTSQQSASSSQCSRTSHTSESRSVTSTTSSTRRSRDEVLRCPKCAVELPVKSTMGPRSTHIECSCCRRLLNAKDWFSESEMRRSCDRRCTNCVDGWRRKRKCHEDERKREQERVREVKAKKEISVVPTETPTTSEELEALESEWNTLNATNTELQDLLKTVRQLVSDQEKQTSKLSTIDRDKDEIIYLVQSIITQNKGGLEEERLAFATKYAEAQQKPISKLPLDERERMKMDENGLLEQTIEFGTIEITLYSYLLRRYDQALPIRVQEFMAKYSKENGSAQGLVNAMTQQQPPATHSSKTKTTAETETKPDVVSTKHTITVTECSRCHGPFRASVSTQSTSSDKRFCDCCVRLLPEASFSSTEWQKRRPMRCRECTGELDVANTQALEKLERQEVFLKRIDDLHRAARASWTSTLTTFYPLEEARRLVSNDLQLKQYEADLTVSKFEVHKMLLHCRNLLANDNSIERMGRDKALYATYQNTQRSIRMLLAARLQLYSVLVTRFGYRLQYYLTQEIVQVVHEAMHELS